MERYGYVRVFLGDLPEYEVEHPADPVLRSRGAGVTGVGFDSWPVAP
ncbi:hypothetical protein [Actinoplanes couchii]|uniref:Uncharacterized protein n=1 Tax=Actinoplanes couchii TaxID=403638 RepID=A0ABQ3XFU9_9ACTN|nr:hypothetical protein [Actinoplanes couchii]MDR6321696.1 hypothetical protein [Actinoplanes couchii]GID57348.1 hypothetical protein Aco03nite_057520 [Actinoplanes couchii]